MADLDFTVRLRSLTTATAVDVQGKFYTVKRVAIMVGPYGPITKDFKPGEDTPELINQWKVEQQAQVRAIYQEV
jgi:hypothetical protein